MDKLNRRIAVIVVLGIISLIVYKNWKGVEPEERSQYSIQFDLGQKAYSEKRYADAQSLFLKVKEPSEYLETRIYLDKIDSIRKANPHKVQPKATTEKSTASKLDKGKWYEGGTLHRATVTQWKLGTEANKLATCGDYISGASKGLTLEQVLIRAVELRACINEATRGIDNVDNDRVSQIAAICAVVLGH